MRIADRRTGLNGGVRVLLLTVWANVENQKVILLYFFSYYFLIISLFIFLLFLHLFSSGVSGGERTSRPNGRPAGGLWTEVLVAGNKKSPVSVWLAGRGGQVCCHLVFRWARYACQASWLNFHFLP